MIKNTQVKQQHLTVKAETDQHQQRRVLPPWLQAAAGCQWTQVLRPWLRTLSSFSQLWNHRMKQRWLPRCHPKKSSQVFIPWSSCCRDGREKLPTETCMVPVQNQNQDPERRTHSPSQCQRSSSCYRFFCPDVCLQTREGWKSPPYWMVLCLSEHCSRFHLLPRQWAAFLVPGNHQTWVKMSVLEQGGISNQPHFTWLSSAFCL